MEIAGTEMEIAGTEMEIDGASFPKRTPPNLKGHPILPSEITVCTLQKLYIIYKPELGTLNARYELDAHCRHNQCVVLDKT